MQKVIIITFMEYGIMIINKIESDIMKTKTILFLIVIGTILITACGRTENSSEISKEEKIKNINYFLDITLPNSTEVLEYYCEDEIEENNKEILEAKVRINKSDYNSFITSLGEYYSDYKESNRSFGPSANGQANLSWWKYDDNEIYDYFNIMKIPLHQNNSEELKMTANTYFVVLNSGDTYDILMSYMG